MFHIAKGTPGNQYLQPLWSPRSSAFQQGILSERVTRVFPSTSMPAAVASHQHLLQQFNSCVSQHMGMSVLSSSLEAVRDLVPLLCGKKLLWQNHWERLKQQSACGILETACTMHSSKAISTLQHAIERRWIYSLADLWEWGNPMHITNTPMFANSLQGEGPTLLETLLTWMINISIQFRGYLYVQEVSRNRDLFRGAYRKEGIAEEEEELPGGNMWAKVAESQEH